MEAEDAPPPDKETCEILEDWSRYSQAARMRTRLTPDEKKALEEEWAHVK